ncbi:MAG: hypothetical protein IPJ66_12370 [Bacteroidetes bacterium]|nr:hypothetical protein [Bacteroidota bacterium]
MKKFSDALLLILVCGTMLLIFISGSGMIEPVTARMQPFQIKNSWLKASPDQHLLKTGDLIFRHGRGFISNAFQQLSRKDKRFSHAGIIVVENGNVFVYHCIGGEENKTNKMKKESLANFCRPDQNHSFAIYRTDLQKEQVVQLENDLLRHYREGLEFDTDFDLKSDGKMYCTELVYKLLTSASRDNNFLPLTRFSGRTYVSCDNIYLSPHCREIYVYNYSNQ